MGDMPAMAELINHQTERGRMLHRSWAYLYERVRSVQKRLQDQWRGLKQRVFVQVFNKAVW